MSASGAQVMVEPLATGVSTRLVCPSSWDRPALDRPGRDWRTEAAGGGGGCAGFGTELLEAVEFS